MTALLVLLFGLVVMVVSGSCLWAFVQDVPTFGWHSDFALGVSSLLMLLVGGLVAGCGFLYLVL